MKSCGYGVDAQQVPIDLHDAPCPIAALDEGPKYSRLITPWFNILEASCDKYITEYAEYKCPRSRFQEYVRRVGVANRAAPTAWWTSSTSSEKGPRSSLNDDGRTRMAVPRKRNNAKLRNMVRTFDRVCMSRLLCWNSSRRDYRRRLSAVAEVSMQPEGVSSVYQPLEQTTPPDEENVKQGPGAGPLTSNTCG